MIKAVYIKAQDLAAENALSQDMADMIEGCIANDRVSQEALYKFFQPKMMGLCMRYYGDRNMALEQVNLGFLKVYQNLKKYKGEGSFEGWIYRIVQRTALDDLRKKLNRKNTEIQHDDMTEFDAGDGKNLGLEKLYVTDLLKLLDQLNPISRVVFNLFAIEDMAHKDISKELGISEGTSKWHLSEARKKMKQLIEKHYEMG